jgi:hypothetical protein
MKPPKRTKTDNSLLGRSGGRQLLRDVSSDTDHGIIFLILVSKLLAQHLLKFNLFKRLGVLSSMRLGQLGIVGSRLCDESDLLISELPQKFGWVSSPYLNSIKVGQEKNY